jgi:hypothetical protein
VSHFYEEKGEYFFLILQVHSLTLGVNNMLSLQRETPLFWFMENA